GSSEFISVFKRNNKEFFVRIRLRAVKDNRKPLIVLSCLDVTETIFSGAYCGLIVGFGDILFSMDADKKFLSVSGTIAETLGYSSEELVGEPFATIVASKDNKVINEVMVWMRSKSDRVDGIEMRMVSKSGIAKVFLLGCQSFFGLDGEINRVYGVLRDIDQLKKRTEGEYIHSKIMPEISDGICWIDTAGYVRYWNNAAQRLLGYSKEEMLGRDVRKLFPPEKEWELSWALGGKMKEKAVETERIGKNGEMIPVKVVSKAMRDGSGNLIGCVEILRDMRMEIRLKEIEAIRKQLENKNRHLKNEMQDKSAFISEVSHELRTPLTSIYGYSLLIQEGDAGPLNPGYKRYVDKIVDETERLRRFINDALELSRIESGRFNFDPQQFELSTLEEKCSCMALANKKGLYVRWELEDDLPSIYADPRGISQVLINLISNAIKFTDEGGVVVRAVKKSHMYVRVEVTDTGEGIPENEKKNVFKRFRRVASEKKREGTGLGLAIAKKIVELNGGRITFESKVGKGTTFYFMVPIRKRKSVKKT
ncbi:MAG: PAS domain S-box protein, partial [Candidatus Micrarchaeota archaeon]